MMAHRESQTKPVVWWVNHYAVTPDMPGGTRHYDLGTELAHRGFHVVVLASDVSLTTRKRTRLRQGERFRVERHGDVEFGWVASAEYEANNWRRVWNMLSFARNLRYAAQRLTQIQNRPPDVVIGSSPHLFAAHAALRIANDLRAPFLLELRDLWPQALVDMGGVSEKQLSVRIMRWQERRLYASAAGFVVLARGSIDYLQARGVDATRIRHVPNGVHTAHFQRLSDREVVRSGLGFDRFTIVYAGAHGPANALETIVDAAQSLAGIPVQFVLVGDGPSKPELVKRAADRGVNNVRFMAPVPKSDIPDLLGAADVGVITLRNARAFASAVSPNKLFDYMGAGLPIICSVPGDMAAMVEQAGAGIVCPPEDAEALASAARRMYDAPLAQRQAWGESGAAFLRANYRREMLADRLAEAIDVVLARAPERARPDMIAGAGG